MENEKEETERFFTIELKSKAHLKTINLENGPNHNVIVEGTIGMLMQAAFVEGVILEIIGKKGTLRINLEKNELRKLPNDVSELKEER